MKTVTFTCVGTKKINKKDGSGVINKSFLLHDPIERDIEGQQVSILWGPELVPGEVYDGILGYNRSGVYGIVDIYEG